MIAKPVDSGFFTSIENKYTKVFTYKQKRVYFITSKQTTGNGKMTNQELKCTASKFRSFLKAEGIKASLRVTGGTICFNRFKYEIEHSESELFKALSFAKSQGLTFVRGIKVKPEADSLLTGRLGWNFH